MNRVVLAFVIALAMVGGPACVIHATDSSVGTVSSDGSVYLGWHLFKKKKRDREIYNVGKQHGKFSAVRLHSNKKFNFQSVKIILGNGERVKPKVKKKWAKGHWTRWLTLPGGSRYIHSIEVVGRSPGHLAKVEIYGQPSE